MQNKIGLAAIMRPAHRGLVCVHISLTPSQPVGAAAVVVYRGEVVSITYHQGERPATTGESSRVDWRGKSGQPVTERARGSPRCAERQVS